MTKRLQIFLAMLVASLCISCTSQGPGDAPKNRPKFSSKQEIAIFAGGCFWCMEADFEKLPGVLDVESGFTGGHVVNPTYKQVSAGTTGHAEAVRVTYDPSQVSYQQLLEYFWVNVDPTVSGRQFCDLGSQYRSGIFYLNEAQKKAAFDSKTALEISDRLKHADIPVDVASGSYPGEFQLEAQRHAEAEAATKRKAQKNRVMIYTEIAPAGEFYVAEKYHQNYYKKNPIRYKIYRLQCGRDARLIHLWKKKAK